MKVRELIAALAELPPDADVSIYDNDYETGGLYVPVTLLSLSVDEDGKNAYVNPW